MPHVRALVMGLLGAWMVDVASMGMTVGCSASSPPSPLGKIRPRIKNLIATVGREILDVEDIAHVVLVARYVNLVCIVVVALDHLERSVDSREKFGLAFIGVAVLAKV